MMLSAVDSRKRDVDEQIINELEVLAMNEEEIREALEEWEKLSVNPENRYAYEMRLKWLVTSFPTSAANGRRDLRKE